MQENFLPWFAQHGHHCFAVSFRGHGTSSDQSACPDTYAQSNDDLAHVIASLPQPPVLIAHSMGGFFGQRWVAVHAQHSHRSKLACCTHTLFSQIKGGLLYIQVIHTDQSLSFVTFTDQYHTNMI